MRRRTFLHQSSTYCHVVWVHRNNPHKTSVRHKPNHSCAYLRSKRIVTLALQRPCGCFPGRMHPKPLTPAVYHLEIFSAFAHRHDPHGQCITLNFPLLLHRQVPLCRCLQSISFLLRTLSPQGSLKTHRAVPKQAHPTLRATGQTLYLWCVRRRAFLHQNSTYCHAV